MPQNKKLHAEIVDKLQDAIRRKGVAVLSPMECRHVLATMGEASPAAALGSITSVAKKKSSAENGKLGGRPRKEKKI